MGLPEIWPKFTETSQHMEIILGEFDDVYWTLTGNDDTGSLGRPNRAAGQPRAGLRDLYCFWMDSVLTDIESDAAVWVKSTTANYRSAFAGEPNGKKWLDNVLKPGGYISESNLKFPKALSRHAGENPSDPKIWTQSNFEGLWDSVLGAAGPF